MSPSPDTRPSRSPARVRDATRRFQERRRKEGYKVSSIFLKAETADVIDAVKRNQGFRNRSQAIEYIAARCAELGITKPVDPPSRNETKEDADGA